MLAAMSRQTGGSFEVVDDLEIDSPIGREVLIDVRASGLCHSDLHAVQMGHTVTFPSVRGHEIAGIVSAVGPDARDIHIGDHVVGCLVPWCGDCVRCKQGHKTLCAHPERISRAIDEPPRLRHGKVAVSQGQGIAGFASSVLTHENHLTAIDKSMPFAPAAIIGCSVITGMGAVDNVARVSAGETVAVFGAGGVGINVINAASAAGASQIIAIDLIASKLNWAHEFGATSTVNARETDPVDAIRELTNGGVDHAFEVVGASTTQDQAWRSLGVGGSEYLMGMSAKGTNLTIDTSESHRMQKTIRQVYLGNSDPRQEIPKYVHLYQQGILPLDGFITSKLRLEDINEGYASLIAGDVIRSVITEF